MLNTLGLKIWRNASYDFLGIWSLIRESFSGSPPRTRVRKPELLFDVMHHTCFNKPMKLSFSLHLQPWIYIIGESIQLLSCLLFFSITLGIFRNTLENPDKRLQLLMSRWYCCVTTPPKVLRKIQKSLIQDFIDFATKPITIFFWFSHLLLFDSIYFYHFILKLRKKSWLFYHFTNYFTITQNCQFSESMNFHISCYYRLNIDLNYPHENFPQTNIWKSQSFGRYQQRYQGMVRMTPWVLFTLIKIPRYFES